MDNSMKETVKAEQEGIRINNKDAIAIFGT